ncbi:hypothetical protein EB001_09795 [bacterium]|jgi:hypothetical protein|nr:hypothetical protein [bacterium]
MRFNLDKHLNTEYGNETCDKEYIDHVALTQLGYKKINSNQWLNHNMLITIKSNFYEINDLKCDEQTHHTEHENFYHDLKGRK